MISFRSIQLNWVKNICWMDKRYKERFNPPLHPPLCTGINVQIWWETSHINIASIPVSATLSLNDFKQGRLYGSQTLLTYMQRNTTMKTRTESIFLHKTCNTLVRACLCVSLHALSGFLCASVSLCICVCRGHVYKKSSTRCHTQI